MRLLGSGSGSRRLEASNSRTVSAQTLGLDSTVADHHAPPVIPMEKAGKTAGTEIYFMKVDA